jgi:hypothetical protein
MSNVKDYRYISPLSGAKGKVPDMTCPRAVRYLGEKWPPLRLYEELCKLPGRIQEIGAEKKEAREEECLIQCDISLRKVGLAKLQLAVLNQSEELSNLSERIQKIGVEKKEAREQVCRIQCDISLREADLAILKLAVLNKSEAIRELREHSESILAGVDDLEDEEQGERFKYRVAKMALEGKIRQLEVSSR